jgi:hypothetical protein
MSREKLEFIRQKIIHEAELISFDEIVTFCALTARYQSKPIIDKTVPILLQSYESFCNSPSGEKLRNLLMYQEMYPFLSLVFISYMNTFVKKCEESKLDINAHPDIGLVFYRDYILQPHERFRQIKILWEEAKEKMKREFMEGIKVIVN